MKVLSIFLPMVLTASAAGAQDLPPGSAERKAVITAVRRHAGFEALRDVKLDVRRIWASEHLAYLCALAIDASGHHLTSDGLYEVYQVALERRPEQSGDEVTPKRGDWVVSARLDGLSETVRDVQCHADANGRITDAFLQAMVSATRTTP